MVATLKRQGDSYALLLDQQTVDQLRIDETTSLDIVCDGNVIILSPHRPSDDISDAEFRAALDKAHKNYGVMLQHLAE